MRRRLPVLLALLLALAVVPSARAGEPPNQKDPCSKAGRDSCGTTGVGSYKTYRFGIRWFGDYRHAIDGVDGSSFCIDLRYWYPSADFKYVEKDASGLKNRNGRALSSTSLHRMAYALWHYGRSSTPSQQAAVMLYVHSLMGDGAPGEIDPKAIGVQSAFTKIAAESARLAGPYRLTSSLPKAGTVGKSAALAVKLVAASGAAVPGASVAVDADGAQAPKTLRTGSDGTAKASVVPTDAGGDLDVTLSVDDLPSTLPKLYVPTRADAARSGQRLVVPASQTLTAKAAQDVSLAQVNVSTAAAPSVDLAGKPFQDKVTATGVPKTWKATVDVRLYGPARTPDAISCDGPPVKETSYTAKPGVSMTPGLVPDTPGYYGYQLVVADATGVSGVTTPCAEAPERFKAETQPAVETQVSTALLEANAPLSDTLAVTGLNGESVPVQASLYGPFPTAAALNCDGAPVWTGTVSAPGDGSYVTAPTQLTVPGYYVYRESIAPTEFVRAYTAPCADGPETAIVRGHPVVHTQVSTANAAPGAPLSDTAVVSGLGGLTADVSVALYGPFPSPDAITCDGTPVAMQTLSAVGDGPHVTDPVTLPAAGYYTYHESIIGTGAYDGTATGCGESTETTIARADPAITTVASAEAVRPGGTVADKINVTGLGATPASIKVDFFGPFRTRGAISCAGDPKATQSVDVKGDGITVSPQFNVTDAGFYVFRERIADAPLLKGVTTPCADAAETSLGAPLIITGRGDEKIVYATTPLAPKGDDPARVSSPQLGVAAKVYGVDIDPAAGVLAIPADISRVGWWRDGAALGDKTGTVLLAGHVDSAARGAGAFYGLKGAKVGQRVKVTSANGKTYTYRVTGKQTIVKQQIPLGIFTRSGPPRLVMVTCGGPFDASAGHYRDNVIVTAVPV